MKNLQPLSNRLGALPGSSLAGIKTKSLAREEEDKSRRNRVKGLLVLVEQFLADQGYGRSLQCLQEESQVSLHEFSVADNIDLLNVIYEYEQFYQFKYQKKPKLFRHRNGAEENVNVVSENGERMLVRRSKGTPTSSMHIPPRSAPVSLGGGAGSLDYTSLGASSASTGGCEAKGYGSASNPPSHLVSPNSSSALDSRLHKKVAKPLKRVEGGGEESSFNLEGVKMQVICAPERSSSTGKIVDDNIARGDDDRFYVRALKPLPVFPTGELADLAATIMREILEVNPGVHWNDISELHHAKQLLKEAIVMPVKYPELFEGIVRPWKGILLFGPPGTGKTLLAKAVATECRTTFFNISASSVVSKWRGDSEKLVRMLFDLAVHYAPSTIFIDEIDSLISSRSSEGEHESSRRMKTELLTQMDGLSKRQGGEIVFVLAASNVPWDLDAAMLRRLEKRILITLPSPNARMMMFCRLLGNRVEDIHSFNWETCAEMTNLMSGADVDTICREAIMRPIRKCIAELEQKNISLEDLSKSEIKQPKVNLCDVEASVACTRSSVRQVDLKRYEKWMQEFGSGLST